MTSDFAADPTLAFHAGNRQSVEAHESVRPSKRRLRDWIVAYVAGQGVVGATVDEVEVALSMPHQTVSARVTEAKALRLLVDSGLRRRTRSGRNASVLVSPPSTDG